MRNKLFLFIFIPILLGIQACGSTMPKTDQALFGYSRTVLQLKAIDDLPADTVITVTINPKIPLRPQALPGYTNCRQVRDQGAMIYNAKQAEYQADNPPNTVCSTLLDGYLCGEGLVPIVSSENEEGEISYPGFFKPGTATQRIVAKTFIALSPSGEGGIYALVER